MCYGTLVPGSAVHDGVGAAVPVVLGAAAGGAEGALTLGAAGHRITNITLPHCFLNCLSYYNQDCRCYLSRCEGEEEGEEEEGEQGEEHPVSLDCSVTGGGRR